eukprot:scaffold25268_cov21-Tisochrysis_lutea.AAC.1
MTCTLRPKSLTASFAPLTMPFGALGGSGGVAAGAGSTAVEACLPVSARAHTHTHIHKHTQTQRGVLVIAELPHVSDMAGAWKCVVGNLRIWGACAVLSACLPIF